MIFIGAHNAGNDAVANLKANICVVLDSLFGTEAYDDDDGKEDPDAYIADVVPNDTIKDAAGHMNTNLHYAIAAKDRDLEPESRR